METASPMHGYRQDIDGLRAIAVLLVVGFHAFPTLLPAGFIGVDIFFVISGYLISGIVLRQSVAGEFSIREFYSRRSRRILPALVLVLLTTWLVGRELALADEFQNLGRHLFASALFTNNFVLADEVGYFDGGGATKPLLHLWSLAVEEQFYLFWPLLLWFGSSRGKNLSRLPWLMIVGVALSFGLNVYRASAEPDSNFYLLPSRLWELMLGGLLAYAKFERKEDRGEIGWSEKLASYVPALLVAVALGFAHKGEYPGWAALLPTLAAFLFLANDERSSFNRFLSRPFFALIGKISYPLYLWHWPMLAFAQMEAGKVPELQMRMALVCLAFVFALLTWKLVEVPAQASPFRAWVPTGLVALLLIGGLGFRSHQGHLMTQTQRAQMKLASYGAFKPLWGPENCFLGNPKDDHTKFGKDCVAKEAGGVFVWGDSFSAALWPGLDDYLKSRDLSLSMLSSSLCPPILNFRIKAREHCLRTNLHVYSRILKRNPKVVILAARWSFYMPMDDFFQKFRETIRALHDQGVEKVVIVGQAPAWDGQLYRTLMRNIRDAGDYPRRSFATLDRDVRRKDRELKRWAERREFPFVGVFDALCDRAGCLTQVGPRPGTDLSTFDGGHLTMSGAKYFVARSLGPRLTEMMDEVSEMDRPREPASD